MAKSKKVEPAIEVRNITKEFLLPQYQNDSLKQLIVHGFKRNVKTKRTVLDDISFTINKGDFFGIVGRNGSGKSTLLKLICGIYTPTSGEIITHGKITPFIELGVGFNSELSGRDNVYLNGALLGFSRKAMHKMYDEIVEFAELEEFMDLKLKNYSSGMQVRLAFSIAIKVKSDILIFDEVLAVGDAGFQEKCLRQFREFKKLGRTVVLVTHSMPQVEEFCNRAVLIEDGVVKHDGTPSKVAELYNSLYMSKLPNDHKTDEIERATIVSKVDILDSKGRPSRIIEPNGEIGLKLTIKSKDTIKNAFFAVRVCESQNQFVVLGFDNDYDGVPLDIKKGEHDYLVKIKNNPFIKGKFYIVVGIYESVKRRTNYDLYNGLMRGEFFMIRDEKLKTGIVSADRIWPDGSAVESDHIK